jgi:hypothetical protein
MSVPVLGPCPICGACLSRPTASCPRCHTAHHLECWEYNGGCSIYGCESRPVSPSASPVVPPAVNRMMWGSVALLTLLTAITIVRHACAPVHSMGPRFSHGSLQLQYSTNHPTPVVIEVTTQGGGRTPLFRTVTATGNFHTARVTGVRPGEIYLARAWTPGVCGISGPVATEVVLAPRPEAAQPVSYKPAVASKDPSLVDFPHSPLASIRSSLRLKLEPDLPLSHPDRIPGNLDLHWEPGSSTAAFRSIDIETRPVLCSVRFRTRRPMSFCRVVLSRDASLHGIERVFDAQTRRGVFHSVEILGLAPDTSYQVLILAFPSNGDPVQSPILAFRTMSSN